MNKTIIAATLGFVSGAVCGIIGTKLYLEKSIDDRANAEIDAIRESMNVVVDDDLEEVTEEVEVDGEMVERTFKQRTSDQYHDYRKYSNSPAMDKPASILDTEDEAEDPGEIRNVFDPERQVPTEDLIDIVDTEGEEVRIPDEYSYDQVTYYDLDSEFYDEGGNRIDENIEDWLGTEAYELLTDSRDDVSILNHSNSTFVDVIFNEGSREQDLEGPYVEEDLDDLNDSELSAIDREEIERIRKAKRNG